ncbi:MAG: SDR family oxidoreductase [Caldilineaceae bacterium]|nr:SDR family oxidoreductase [Caldilineaceae bacterium]
MDWKGRVAVVTGGASGIGAATVAEFAAAGVAVALLDINAQAGRQMAGAAQVQGQSVEFHEVNVAEADACLRAIQAVGERWGRIDFLVNNAASFISKGLDVTPADWERSLGVNVRGYANMVQACYPFMRTTRGAAIVNMASISAHVAQPNRWTYNAGKGAIVALTKCQALDLAPDGIRVNAVSPGWIWTPEVQKAAEGDRAKWEPIWGRYHMLRRLGEPREVARAILFLCSEDASFITSTELAVDGGYMGLGSEGLGDTSSFAGTA